MLALGEREAAEIAEKFPKVQRRVGGYNLDALVPRNAANNMAHLLVGSEGTLAFTTQVELKLWPVIRNKVLGVCHFGSFYEAMDAAQHLVKLRPIAVELVDRTMLALGREIAMFQPIIGTAVRGDPDAVLIVEFAEEDQAENIRRLKQLGELMADLGFGWNNPQRKWGGVVEIIEPGLQTGDRRVPRRRPQRHDVDEAGGQAGLVRRGLRGAAAASGRLYRAAQRHLRQARHPRHHVCARLRRLPACAPGAEPEARKGRQGDARHRRRNLRDGARIQGLAFRRARRRHRALGIPRDDVRPAHHRRFQGGQAPLRSGQCAQSRQDRRSAQNGRPRAVSLSAGLSRRRIEDRARLVGLSRRRRRFPGRGRDVQQQRRLPQARRRRDVPVLSRHPQRKGRHARPRQYAAAGDLRPVGTGRAGLRRDDGHAEALRVLQGLPPRMPDRRRHGQDEDRGAGRARRQARAFAARPAGRLSAALCRPGVALRPARQSAQQQPAAAQAVRKIRRHQRAARAAGMAARRVQVRRRSGRPGRRPRSRAVRRHLQPRL